MHQPPNEQQLITQAQSGDEGAVSLLGGHGDNALGCVRIQAESDRNAAPTAQVIPSGTPIPLPTPTADRLVTIEGPVNSITDHVITIYGFQIDVEPDHPIFQIIDVGDVVRVEGVLNDSGVVLAAVVSNLPDAAAPAADNRATVGLDGPVEAIDGNILVVNSISVQLAPNDSLLQTVQSDSFVSVQDNFRTSNAGIVLVVVNIAIVNNISVESNC